MTFDSKFYIHGYTISEFESFTENIPPYTKEESYKYTDKWEESSKGDKEETVEKETKEDKQPNKERKGKSKKEIKD